MITDRSINWKVDKQTKPPFALYELISEALRHSREATATEICMYIEDNYAYYKAKSVNANSIRAVLYSMVVFQTSKRGKRSITKRVVDVYTLKQGV